LRHIARRVGKTLAGVHHAHRFTDITEDLALLLVLGPAYNSRRA
jgi:hypothetical protein